MATLLPPGKSQFIDGNGVPLAGGSVYFYVPNTTTPKDTWQDSGQITLNTNPVILDASGEAIIYGSGVYRQQVYDSAGNLVWDQVTASTDTGGLAWGGTSTGSADAQVIASSSFSQQDGQQIAFIVGDGLTNTGAMTVAPGGGTGISVLIGKITGPQPASGGEAAAGNEVTLVYDATRGAFHMVNPAFGALNAITISNSTISTSTIVLKQASDPTPTDEGDLQWSTLFNNFKVGDGSGTQRFFAGPAPGALFGCTIANNVSDATNDIDFATGTAADSTNAFYMTLASALTKRLDATWAVGTNQGGLFSGSIANTTYHCFIIMRLDTGVVDAGFDTSVTAANRPADYTYYRRVGSIIRASAAIRAFVQTADTFFLSTPVNDASYAGTSGQALTTMTLPGGLIVRGQFQLDIATSGATTNVTTIALSDPRGTSITQNVSSGADGGAGSADQRAGGVVQQYCNTSSQVYIQVSGSPVATNRVYTLGWTDTRGR